MLCGDRGGFGYGFDHSGGILATEDVFFAVFEGDRETVGGFAVICDIFADVFPFEPAIPAEPSAIANDPYCPIVGGHNLTAAMSDKGIDLVFRGLRIRRLSLSSENDNGIKQRADSSNNATAAPQIPVAMILSVSTVAKSLQQTNMIIMLVTIRQYELNSTRFFIDPFLL